MKIVTPAPIHAVMIPITAGCSNGPPDEDCAVGTVAGGMVVTAMGCMTVGTGGLLHSAGECPEYVGNLTGKHVDDPLIS